MRGYLYLMIVNRAGIIMDLFKMTLAGVSTLDKLNKKTARLGGWKAFRDGQALFERALLKNSLMIHLSRVMTLDREVCVAFEVLSNGLVENHCPCRDNQERGLICSHLAAMG